MRTANPYSPGSPEPLAVAAATPLPSPPTPAPIPNPIRVALLADFEITRWTLSASPRVTSVVISPRASVRAVSDTLISLPFRFCPFLSRTDTSSPAGTALSPSQEPLIGVGVTCANVICGFANNAIRTRATVTARFFPIFMIVLPFHLPRFVNDLASTADDRSDYGANGGAESHCWVLNSKVGLLCFADPVSNSVSAGQSDAA